MKLYKYTRFDVGKQIISSSQIALSKPQDFNDPFDCLPVPNEDDLSKAIDVLNGYIIDQKIFEIMQDLKAKLRKPSQKALVSCVLWEYRFAQKLAKHKPAPYSPIFTFTKFYKLFNMCEKMGKVSAEQLQAKEKITQLKSLIEQHEWDTLSKMTNMRESLHIACLSAVYDSILMWSYYGENHHGVCLEIDVDEESEYLSKVEYKSERPYMQMEKLIRDFCGKMFAQSDMSNVNKDPVLLPLVAQPYVTKAKEWEHEREYRLLYLEDVFEKNDIEKHMCSDGKERYFCPIKITKVFCGANMIPEDKKALRKIIPAHIEIVEMKISENKYELLTQ